MVIKRYMACSLLIACSSVNALALAADTTTSQGTPRIEGSATVIVPPDVNLSYNPNGPSNLEKGQKFLEDNKKETGVVTLPSGLQYKVIKEGSGQSPGKDDFVKVHYTGTLINGMVFDSSEKRGQPTVFPVSAVIPGWTEALQKMKPGAEWMIYVPPNLAYGLRGVPNMIGPNEVLVFDI